VTKQFHNVLTGVPVAEERRWVADGPEFTGGADDGLAVCPQSKFHPAATVSGHSASSRRLTKTQTNVELVSPQTGTQLLSTTHYTSYDSHNSGAVYELWEITSGIGLERLPAPS